MFRVYVKVWWWIMMNILVEKEPCVGWLIKWILFGLENVKTVCVYVVVKIKFWFGLKLEEPNGS